MSARDPENRAILDNEADGPSPPAEHSQRRNLLSQSRQALKAHCQTALIGWILLFFVAMTAFSAFLAGRKTNECNLQVSPTILPENAAGMAVLLRDKFPEARIVSTRADGYIDRSFILTVRSWDEATLRRLPRVSDRAEQWRGTVLCEWLVDWQPAELFLEEWGEYGLMLPPFVFFGDKDLLVQIKEAVR